MTQALATRNGAEMIEQVLVNGNLAELTPEQRVVHYRQLCESLSLNPLTKPFEYLTLDGKLVLYARRDATDQLRRIHGVSIVRLERERMEDLYVVTAYARTADGREDSAIGAVPLVKEGGEWRSNQNGKRYFQGNGQMIPLTGDALANAIMKAETKAKRRVTLSICGLGWSDETEIETIPRAQTVRVDHETGEIIEGQAVEQPAEPVYDRTALNERWAAAWRLAGELGVQPAQAIKPDMPDATVAKWCERLEAVVAQATAQRAEQAEPEAF